MPPRRVRTRDNVTTGRVEIDDSRRDILLAQSPVGGGPDVLEVMIAMEQDRVVRDRIGRDQAVEGRGGAREPVIPERL